METVQKEKDKGRCKMSQEGNNQMEEKKNSHCILQLRFFSPFQSPLSFVICFREDPRYS